MKRDPKITHTRGDCIVVNNRQQAFEKYNKMTTGERLKLMSDTERETGKSTITAMLDFLFKRDK